MDGNRSYNLESMEEENNKRGYWANKLEFLLACFGNAWGISIWTRFPFLCYISGGFPVFFVAYAVMLIHLGFPMLLLEMTIGQYSSQGVSTVWRMCPLFYGIGASIFIYMFVTLCIYAPVISWPAYYMYVSFTSAWKSCANAWNTNRCGNQFESLDPSSCEERSYTLGYDGFCYNDIGERVAIYDNATYLTEPFKNTSIAISEYFTRYFLATGATNFELQEADKMTLIFFAACWVIIALCLCLGPRSYGKAGYVISLLPIPLLIVFLVRAVTLPGQGMDFLFSPDFTKLSELRTWLFAASEVIYGLGLGYGGYVTLSSYNRFQNLYVIDAIIVLMVHVVARLFTAVIVLGFVGFVAYEEGESIQDVMSGGFEVIFAVIPGALNKIPSSKVWSFFFFLLVFFMMLGRVLTMMEVFITALCDLSSFLRKFRFVVVAIFSIVFFSIGVFFFTSGGRIMMASIEITIFPFVDLAVICAMCVCVAVFYGLYRFSIVRDIRLMLGDRHWCVVFILAFFLIVGAYHWFLLPITSMVYLGFSAKDFFFLSLISPVYMYISFAILGVILLPMVVCPIVMAIIAIYHSCSWARVFQPNEMWGPQLTGNRLKATHLPHINVEPTLDVIRLTNITPAYMTFTNEPK